MLSVWSTTNTCITICLFIDLPSNTIIVFWKSFVKNGNIYFCTYLHTHLHLPWYIVPNMLLVTSDSISAILLFCYPRKYLSLFQVSFSRLPKAILYLKYPICFIYQSVIFIYCIFLVGLLLTSACLVVSFALGQGFDELVNWHYAIQTDVIDSNQPRGLLYVSNTFVKGKILIWKCSSSSSSYVVFTWGIYHCWSSSEFLDTACRENKKAFEIPQIFYTVKNKNQFASREKGFPFFFSV